MRLKISSKASCLILIFSFLLFIAGCDKHVKHRYLTFFFTGVPPLEEESTEKEDKEAAKNVPAKKQEKREAAPSYAHGPYASGQCHQCHTTASSATFRGEVRKMSGTAGTTKGVSARLVMPINDLCIDCHTAKSVSSAFNRELWVHGPVSAGDCTVCHHPHQTKYEYLLLFGQGRDMCVRCHTDGYLLETEAHSGDEECTSCHNPHVGVNRYLLKKDFNEAF